MKNVIKIVVLALWTALTAVLFVTFIKQEDEITRLQYEVQRCPANANSWKICHTAFDLCLDQLMSCEDKRRVK